MRIDSYEKAKELMIRREKYQNHVKTLQKDVLPFVEQGRVKFERSCYSPIDTQAPLSLSKEFIQEVIDYYLDKISQIDIEFESL